MRPVWIGLAAAVCVATLATGLDAQTTATFSGTVVDELNSAPLVGALVSLPAANLQTLTDANGRFTIEGVPHGPHEVRFEAMGYVGVMERLDVAGTDFLQVRLDPMAAVLDEIRVMAGRPPRAAGVPSRSVRTRDPERPWQSALDLLEAQVPGVIVRRGGGLANGAAILIRGVNSFQSDGAPLIVVDGIQLDNAQRGDNSFHTLDLIPAEAVSRIRVIKGAAEASAFANGANGVILIETMRGEPN